MPNLLDEAQFKLLKNWNGELRYLQNFKLCRLGKKHLEETGTNSSMDFLSAEKNSKSNSNETQKLICSEAKISNVPVKDDNKMIIE